MNGGASGYFRSVPALNIALEQIIRTMSRCVDFAVGTNNFSTHTKIYNLHICISFVWTQDIFMRCF
jgi:hypothetical protein